MYSFAAMLLYFKVLKLLQCIRISLSLICFCSIMKNCTHPPLHHIWPGLGGCAPPSKSNPVHWCEITWKIFASLMSFSTGYSVLNPLPPKIYITINQSLPCLLWLFSKTTHYFVKLIWVICRLHTLYSVYKKSNI